MVLELEVDGTLGGGELDLDVMLLPLDLVDLGDVLPRKMRLGNSVDWTEHVPTWRTNWSRKV